MMTDLYQQKILILDFGSQYTQLIARNIRECGVYCEIHPFDVADQFIQSFAPCGIVLSGGPETVTQTHTPRAPQIIFDLNIPLLGICYGMQTMVAQLEGVVSASVHREFGYAEVSVVDPQGLFADIHDRFNDGEPCLDVWMSHGDSVSSLPSGFKVTACSKNSPYAAIAHHEKPWFGLQFHPEVSHTKQGKILLSRFVIDICGCEAVWTASNIIEHALHNIQQQVKQDHVVLGLSGGVDSSVVAALLHKALGNQLTCIFVDTGLLRLNEADEVLNTFSEHLGVRVIKINAQQEFLQGLSGIFDPEQKRKIIGEIFIQIFEREAAKINQAKWLAQGTIYPDVIESAASNNSKSQVIKSHHNVGGLPLNMQLKLIEPLRELFKDEVRKMGSALGLPHSMIYRHPFPGPGLAVRILGEVKADFIPILQQADAIFIEELHQHDLYHQVSQAFAVFLPIKSVGVVGDARQYEYVIALRAVETIDFMTAHWAHLPHEFLAQVSSRIINEVRNVSRVVYDISGKPPATIEWE